MLTLLRGKFFHGRIPEAGADHDPPSFRGRLRVGPRPDARFAASISRGRDARGGRRDPGARAGFDGERTEQVLEKVEEEFSELKEAMTRGDPAHTEHELGDVLFSLVNLARFLGLSAEVAMVSANERFERRFREMAKIASETGHSIENTDMRTLDRLWEMAKKSSS